MSMNQTELVAEVASQLVRDDLNTRIATWINWGLTRIDRYCDLKGTQKHVKCAAVVGQTEYALPGDLKYIRTFRLIDHTITTFATSDVNLTTNVITVDEDIATGTKLIFLNSDPPATLVTGTTYYAINVSSTTIKVATTSALATAGTAIDLTDEGSGTHVMEIFDGEGSKILTYMPEKEFDTYAPDASLLSSGKADHYIDKGDMFELTSPPSSRYTMDIRYVKWQDELAAGETPEVSYIDDLIVAATVVEGWHALGELKLRDAAQEYFLNLLSSHRAVDKLRPDYAPVGKGFGSQSAGRWNMQADAYKYPFIKR